ncbi:MAG: arsenate reductase (glutaredoxin) [Rhodospirillaceae bacterium]|nr:arsenate reductase (glutaredoxin) [Rhodospirillaceae bacterium]MDE0253226.1 arsenate reductase (glutaredoxin) [Rhodospirillaceae bacterium]MDE0616631.1 arsenate reductase (glutaredoxin) [Rhodospirillaceae bacterium]
MSVTIWHNPRCSKSRQTLKLLTDRGMAPAIIEYLKTPPDPAELRNALAKLGMAPRDLMRRREPPYKSEGLDDESLPDDALIQAMHDHPVLIERPVVFAGGKAALGRPPERVLDIL